MKKIFKVSYLVWCIILLLSCTKREWDNPYDPASNSRSWMANIDNIYQKAWSNEITISWTNPAKKVDDIIIERAIGSETFTQVAKLPYGTDTWTDKDIKEGGAIYTYKIYAIAGQNKSEISEKQITPVLPPNVAVKINYLTSDSAIISICIENRGGFIQYCEIMLSPSPDFSELTSDIIFYNEVEQIKTDSTIHIGFSLHDTTTYYTKVITDSRVKGGSIDNLDTIVSSFTTTMTHYKMWDSNHKIDNYGGETFYSKIQADTLVIGDNVEVYNYGSSEVVINVKVLELGKNSVIRVRNGFYSGPPEEPVSNFIYNPNSELYPNVYGKGGDGGDGLYDIYGGGGGGYGGGQGGSSGGYGSAGSPNGGDGGSSYSGAGGTGGGRYSLGHDGGYEAGGGGNSGNGGYYGGGGGGYGGGILLINANKIIFDPSGPPKFIVSGQKGGQGENGGSDGQNGQGGVLIINCLNYNYLKSQWDLNNSTYGTHDYNTGHGIVTGNPLKVYLNGKLVENNSK